MEQLDITEYAKHIAAAAPPLSTERRVRLQEIFGNSKPAARPQAAVLRKSRLPLAGSDA